MREPWFWTGSVEAKQGPSDWAPELSRAKKSNWYAQITCWRLQPLIVLNVNYHGDWLSRQLGFPIHRGHVERHTHCQTCLFKWKCIETNCNNDQEPIREWFLKIVYAPDPSGFRALSGSMITSYKANRETWSGDNTRSRPEREDPFVAEILIAGLHEKIAPSSLWQSFLVTTYWPPDEKACWLVNQPPEKTRTFNC